MLFRSYLDEIHFIKANVLPVLAENTISFGLCSRWHLFNTYSGVYLLCNQKFVFCRPTITPPGIIYTLDNIHWSNINGWIPLLSEQKCILLVTYIFRNYRTQNSVDYFWGVRASKVRFRFPIKLTDRSWKLNHLNKFYSSYLNHRCLAPQVVGNKHLHHGFSKEYRHRDINHCDDLYSVRNWGSQRPTTLMP